MGPFLVEPLLAELATVAESPAPLHDARRLLEVLVPLVYRPAIKAAMLAAPFASTLAHLLGEQGRGASQHAFNVSTSTQACDATVAGPALTRRRMPPPLPPLCPARRGGGQAGCGGRGRGGQPRVHHGHGGHAGAVQPRGAVAPSVLPCPWGAPCCAGAWCMQGRAGLSTAELAPPSGPTPCRCA